MLKNLEFLPEFLTPQDLISIGLYKSRDSLNFAKSKGNVPDFIKIGRRILYPKLSVRCFVEEHWHNSKDASNHRPIDY
jgi:hypothetical protein